MHMYTDRLVCNYPNDPPSVMECDTSNGGCTIETIWAPGEYPVTAKKYSTWR